MHEMGIMKEVLTVALDFAERNSAQKVLTISLEVGALSDIVPRFAQMFFTMLAKDTMAEEAKIEIDTIPARVRCRQCGEAMELEIGDLIQICPHCAGKELGLISGREFRVRSMEII